MTVISPHSDRSRRRPQSFTRVILRWIARAQIRRRERRELDELSRLSPHLLKDMGLERHAKRHDPTLPSRWQW